LSRKKFIKRKKREMMPDAVNYGEGTRKPLSARRKEGRKLTPPS